jgi:hypothetical protein
MVDDRNRKFASKKLGKFDQADRNCPKPTQLLPFLAHFCHRSVPIPFFSVDLPTSTSVFFWIFDRVSLHFVPFIFFCLGKKMKYFALILFMLSIASVRSFMPASHLPKLASKLTRRGGFSTSATGTVKSCDLKMSLKEGDRIPFTVFKARVRDETLPGPNPFKWKDVSTDDLFAGKRSVIFALPGAFTPTCSSTHLPGYEEKYGMDSYRFFSIHSP